MAEVLARFEAVVSAQPEAVAIEGDDASWSFAELARASERLAERLLRAGTRPGDVVALSLGRTAEHVAAVLATWRVGAAFLPLDPAAPASRTSAMLGECRARARLTHGAEGVDVEALAPAGAPLGAEGDALAYVIYTSGSTGRPKGVRVSHRGLWPMLGQQIAAFGLSAGKRALLYLSLAFDASISDLFTTLLSGATLVLPRRPPSPEELPGFFAAHAVTHADLPPTVLSLVRPEKLPVCLEAVVIGGEVCPPPVVRAWARRVRVVNVYGPTEATICTHLCACDADAWHEPLLGAPLAHVEQRLHDGELWLAGPALALGYVDRPELEASRFVTHDGTRWYRTGDRVRGPELAFVGRVDRQLKIRGQLVSPEEIEARLREQDGVVDCAVAAVPDGGRDVLTAFVVGGPLDAERVRARLAESLPRWMLPRVLVVSALPRSTSGKVDLHALEAPPRDRGASRIPDPRVRAIAEAFEDVLGVTGVRGDDDFFELGGDSLAALEIASVAGLLGASIEPGAVLGARTPSAIARTAPALGRTVADLEDAAERLQGELPAGDALSRTGTDWLVTGATGFLGARLVRELLLLTDARIHCLVRGESNDAARARLGELAAEKRVVVHAGDVSAPWLGLPEPVWHELSRAVGHVVHAAAAVNLVLSFDALARSNVRGALEIARFVRAGAHKELDHVSSLAVLVATDEAEGTLDERSTLSPRAQVFGGYAQTKVVAEALVRRLVPHARVLRPGLLTGDSVTGASAPRCQLASFLRQLAALGCVPEGDHERLRVDVTPVDHAARALARLATSTDAGKLVHVSSARGASLAELVRALRRRGPIAIVDAAEFRRRARAALPRDVAMALASSAYRLLGGDRHRDADLFLLTGRAFDTTRADGLLGAPCPVADDALLSRYVDAALGAAP